MRVRALGLRLLAAGLTALWTIAAGLVLLGYRPGGPIDGVVGLTALLPIAVSLPAVLWPPATRDGRTFAAVAWLGLGAALLLIPSIAAVLTQLLGRGPQTLLPSPEAAYPWVLALAATGLFAGLGVASKVLDGRSSRRRRLELAFLIAIVASALSGTLFAAAAIGNELALRDRPALASRFGPSTGASEPPACTASLATGSSATLSLTIQGDVDGHPVGTVEIRGSRRADDVSWVADTATEVAVGSFALVRVGATTWTQSPRGGWSIATATTVPAGDVPTALALRPSLDRDLMSTALSSSNRIAAEERGLEFVEGARARHCRIALDGRTFQAAFPAALWMSARQDLHRWRGSLDFWIFLDGEVGQVSAIVNGEAQSLGRAGLQANLSALLSATDRGRAVTILAPSL